MLAVRSGSHGRRAPTAHPQQHRGGFTRLRRRLVWSVTTRHQLQREDISDNDGVSDSDDQIHQLLLLGLVARELGLDLHTLMAHLEEANGGGGGFGTAPASAATVAGLEKQTFHAGEEGCCGGGVTECAICIEEFEDGEEVSVMPCSRGHEFHPECIGKWLGCSNVCPLCRHQLPTTGAVHA